MAGIAAGDFWARSRALKFLRFVHRLDAETSGIVLLVKSPGAVPAYSRLFESRQVEKVYLAIVNGIPPETAWTCRLKLGADAKVHGKVKLNARSGKDAETHLRVLETKGKRALVEARPITGRTHQIRVHLAESACPVVGDKLYGAEGQTGKSALALRAVELAYTDPFTNKKVRIKAPVDEFLREYGFGPKRGHEDDP